MLLLLLVSIICSLFFISRLFSQFVWLVLSCGGGNDAAHCCGGLASASHLAALTVHGQPYTSYNASVFSLIISFICSLVFISSLVNHFIG